MGELLELKDVYLAVDKFEFEEDGMRNEVNFLAVLLNLFRYEPAFHNVVSDNPNFMTRDQKIKFASKVLDALHLLRKNEDLFAFKAIVLYCERADYDEILAGMRILSDERSIVSFNDTYYDDSGLRYYDGRTESDLFLKIVVNVKSSTYKYMKFTKPSRLVII